MAVPGAWGRASAPVPLGLGLRREHYAAIHESPPPVDWFEVLSENYLVPGGPPREHLRRIARRYPLSLHGVGLSIGGTDPLDEAYLRALGDLVDELDPMWVSDHLCWTGVDGRCAHDLLPLPYTQEALAHVSARVQQVQEVLGRPLVLENVSSYVTYAEDEMSEWEFLGELVRRSGCEILLDVNNVYVSAHNHGFPPAAYLQALPPAAVRQIHLAGHSRGPAGLLVDTHDGPVCEPVWDLYREAIRRLGPRPTSIERDAAIPPLEDLLDELARAGREAARALRDGATTALAT